MKIFLPIFLFLITLGAFMGFSYIDFTEDDTLSRFVMPIAFAMIVWVVYYFIIDQSLTDNQKKFERAIAKSPSITIEDIYTIGRFYKLANKEIESILVKVFTDKLTIEGSNEDVNNLRSKIHSIKENKPFSELPEAIKTPLIQIRNKAETTKDDVKQLASAILDFIIKTERRNKMERHLAIIGFIIGIIGVIIPFVV